MEKLITGFPSKEAADRMARGMRLVEPTWTIVVEGNAPPYAIRATPPRGNAARAALAGAVPFRAEAGAAILPPKIDTGARPGALGFLDFIAQFESAGNYNARFGKAGNTGDPRFTDMTVDEVLEWQHVKKKFTACGKYQIIRGTLKGLKAGLNLTGKELYDPALQDRLGLALLEGRGLSRFLAGGLSRKDFAEKVATEWAALPGVNPPHGAKSVHAGDGVNKAHVTVEAYLAAIDTLKATA